jgi:hypothetical protein
VTLRLAGEILLMTTDALAKHPIELPTQSAKRWATFLNSHCQKRADFQSAYTRFLHAESEEPHSEPENLPSPASSLSTPTVSQPGLPPASIDVVIESLPVSELDSVITCYLEQPTNYWQPPLEMDASTMSFYKDRIVSFSKAANLLLMGLLSEWKPNSSVDDLFGS